jgi:hypothetical protein
MLVQRGLEHQTAGANKTHSMETYDARGAGAYRRHSPLDDISITAISAAGHRLADLLNKSLDLG